MFNEITILIVDDDPSSLLFQKKLLQKNIPDVALLMCGNGDSALRDIGSHRVDLIILDVELPDYDGFELYKRIDALYPARKIPVIYLSGYTENVYIKRGFELGAVDYLTKPIDPNLYLNRINLYLQLLSANKDLKELHESSQRTLELVNRYVIASKADTRGIITEVTDAFCKISGFTRDELIGQPHNIVRHPEMSPEVFREVWATIKSGKNWSGEVKNRKKDGSFYWVYAVISPMFDSDGSITGYYSTRQDITADKEKVIHAKALELARKKREEAEKEAKEILESTDSLVIVGNLNECTYANKAFLAFFNVDSLALFKQKYVSVDRRFLQDEGFFNLSDVLGDKVWFEAMMEKKSEGCMVKMRCVAHEGEIHSFVAKVKLLNSTLKRYLVIFDDVTDLEKQRTFYLEAATHDHLTGIYNRYFFKESLLGEIAASKRYEELFSIMILDLDRFKRINDTYGHLEGDYVLKKVSASIGERLRDSDIFARWGGEEFIILMPKTKIEEALLLAEQLRQCIEKISFETVGTVTCSFGLAQWKADDSDKSLISRADTALYEAKAGGRNKVVGA